MKITDVKVFVVDAFWRNWVFVKIYTDEGLTGVGECGLEGKAKTIEAAVIELKRYLVGRDPLQIENHWQNMYYRDAFWTGGPILTSAISGVEAALWDIMGKQLGVPVYSLLGGPCRDKVKLYANAWFVGGVAAAEGVKLEEVEAFMKRGTAPGPEDYAKAAVATVKQGYLALKWDPFGRADRWAVDRKIIQAAIDCVAAVREAVGPDIDLLIECHSRFSPYDAIKVARELEPYHPLFYEEMVPPENVDAMVEVARAINTTLATGEHFYTKWGFREVLEKRACGIIQPDVTHVGGILECKKIAAMAEVHYVPVAPHNDAGLVATAMTIQLDACIPNFVIQEYFISAVPWVDKVVVPAPEIEDGYMKVPTSPGLGVDIDEEECARHPYRPTFLSLFGPPLR